jgi:uncharacterized protein YaaR (DUF327 family)
MLALFKNLNICTYKNIILAARFVCTYVAWSFALKKKHGSKVLKKRALTIICGTNRKLQDVVENCVVRRFVICTLRHSLTVMDPGG